eukprot:2958146-Pleurochrysis_carterae.AAC.1
MPRWWKQQAAGISCAQAGHVRAEALLNSQAQTSASHMFEMRTDISLAKHKRRYCGMPKHDL